MSLLEGFVLTKDRHDALAERLGRTLSDEVWSYAMTGHRVLIVPEPVSERHKGLLYKPRSAVDREELEMGAGYVISVGPCVGQPGAPHPVGVLCEHPSELLGRRVLYRQHSGTIIKTTEEDTEFGGQFALIVLTDRDLLAVGRQKEGV